MPFRRYSSGGTRDKKPKPTKDVTKRTSGPTSVPSITPQSAPKKTKDSPETQKKEASRTQVDLQSKASSRGRFQTDHLQKTVASPQSRSQQQQQLQSTKPSESTNRAPNVFDFLEEGGSDNFEEPGDAADTADPRDSDNSDSSDDFKDDDSSEDSKDPDDSGNFNDGLMSQGDTASVSLSQVEGVSSVSHTDRERPFSPAAKTSQRDPRVIQRGNSSSPNQVPSLVSRTSTDITQPPTPPDGSPVANPLQLNKIVAEQMPSVAGSYSSTGSQSEFPTSAEKPPLDLSHIPEAYYTSPRETTAVRRIPTPPSYPRSPVEYHPRNDRKVRRKPRQQVTSSGYGFVASHLSSRPDDDDDDDGFRVRPLYRRFENLNYRVLLHLQDEIAQMEEDLQVLDEYEEMHRVAVAEQEGAKILPGSRRMEVQTQFHSPLHYRRLGLMDALIHKTEQYNNVLSAFNKVLETLPPASTEDLNVYRAWIKKKRPIAAAESRFLEHKDDLVSLVKQHSSYTTRPALTAQPALPTRPDSSEPANNTPTYPPLAIASAAILLPLLAFGMVSELGGRFVIVSVVSLGIAANCSTDVERLIDSRNGWKYTAMYLCFMTTAALFIP